MWRYQRRVTNLIACLPYRWLYDALYEVVQQTRPQEVNDQVNNPQILAALLIFPPSSQVLVVYHISEARAQEKQEGVMDPPISLLLS
jgi:hypothetical protein